MNSVDLNTQYQRLQDDVQARILAALEHGRHVMGPEIVELEGRFAEMVGVEQQRGARAVADALGSCS